MFGPVWSGSGASAAEHAVGERIVSMELMYAEIAKAICWYTSAANIVIASKMAINGRLVQYDAKLAALEAQNLRGEVRAAAIEDLIRQAYQLNKNDISAAKDTLPSFDEFKYPADLLTNVLRVPEGDTLQTSGRSRHGGQPTTDRPLPSSDSSRPLMFRATDVTTRTSPADAETQSLDSAEATRPTSGTTERAPAPEALDKESLNTDISRPITPTQDAARAYPAVPGIPSSQTGTVPPTPAPAPSPGVPSAGLPSTPPAAPGRSPSVPSSPLLNSGGPPSPSMPTTASPSAMPTQPPMTDMQRAVSEATKTMASQPIQPPPLPPQTPLGSAASAPPPPASAAPSAPATSSVHAPASPGPTSAVGPSPAPIAPPTTANPPLPPPMPLGPPPTPPPAAPVAPSGAGLAGPGAIPASTSGTVTPGPAPVPVSSARSERDAIAAAATAGALRRQGNGNDPLTLARRIAAALNAGTADFGFFWVTGLTADGTILVANSYGIAYIPDGVLLPEQVRMVSADESIPLADRARWATYPILAVQGWAQHHDVQLRAVIATEDQFANFDPGAAKIVLQPDDIPADGTMQGRTRLDVIASAAATQLAAISDAGLQELLPPAPTDATPPTDETFTLWFEVAKPLMSTSTERGVAHLQAFIIYAGHAQELTLYHAHTATDAGVQRAAIADWVYWQHLAVLVSDALAALTSR
ncbi:MAG: hypothetical protein JST91_16050 [Actinobacteria bacterium]|nr:hypothetical protein [Actinomycetota bacterium]